MSTIPAIPTRLAPELWTPDANTWDGDRDGPLICCQVRPETHDVKSFLFEPAAPKQFRHRPGQFLTLELEIGSEKVNRCYTISSPPTRPHTLSITVKRHPGGKVSNWLHDNLKPGVSIPVLGPAGEFSCTLHPANKYLFLSGGSGITPLMSMARTFYDLGEDANIVFAHSARSPDDLIFRRELDMMAAGLSHFKPVFVCDSAPPASNWPGFTGFLSLAMLRAITRDFAQREIFCCGPAPYMANVRAILNGIGFDMRHYHEESFSFEARDAVTSPSIVEPVPSPSSPATSPSSPAKSQQNFKIEFTKTGRAITCAPDQFILNAAKAAGLRLPSSCTQGLCGTCKAKKLSGDVVMTHKGGIRQREIDQGFFLPCCSKPLTDVVIEK